jgi:hypothetical protein
MSVSLCTVGHHHLKTDNVEIVARQLSEVFDINIFWGYWDHEADNFIEQGRITKHEDRPYHELQDNSDEIDPVLYQLDCPDDDDESALNHFFFISVHREMIDIAMCDWPYRSSDYERCFWESEPPMDEEAKESMRHFRLNCKEVFGKLGIERIFCFGDSYSGTGFLEEDCLNLPGAEYEDYILSGRYLDDVEEKSWKEHSMIVNVSDFISGKNPTRCLDYADVFVDDFADL